MFFKKSIEENMVAIKTQNLLPNTNSLLDVVSATKHQTNVNDIIATTIVDCSLYEYIMK